MLDRLALLNGNLEEPFPADFDDALNQTNLLVECHQDIFSLDWHEFAKNYALGYAAIHLNIAVIGGKCEQYNFPFLILKDGITIGGVSFDLFNIAAARTVRTDAERILKCGQDFNQSFPMLVGVSDLIDGPEGIVSSGVWFLGFDEIPLVRREFLFCSFPSGVWEWTRLPVVIESAEGVGYARKATPIEFNKVNCHFIEGVSQMPDSFDNFPSEISRQLFIEACNYVGAIRFMLDPDEMRVRLDEPVNSHFKVVKLMLSSFDLFV